VRIRTPHRRVARETARWPRSPAKLVLVIESETTSQRLIWRSLGMLRAVRGLIVVSLLLGIVAAALPYVAAAAFGPMMQVVADAGRSGNLSGVWDLTGPLVARDDGLLRALAGPVPFGVLLATWAGALLLTQLMYFVNGWVGAKVDRLLVVDIRQRVHDHMQSLSLDFFAGSRTGELIQRVTTESAGVQRLLTDCLLPPLIDAVVLAVAVGYLLMISWQMTVAALVLTPLALITLRFAGGHVGGGAAGDERRPRNGRRARTDGERDRRDPDVQRTAPA
jgi:ATP-binding cassette, subfamily B, bacterial